MGTTDIVALRMLCWGCCLVHYRTAASLAFAF